MFYRRPRVNASTAQMVGVVVITEAPFAVGPERELPIKDFAVTGTSRDYDITSDGQRFLVLFPADQGDSDEAVQPQTHPRPELVRGAEALRPDELTDGTRSRNEARSLRNRLAPRAGGMGEVYKAKDTRLDRTVAIKVLPSHLSDNARLKERFEREARAVSSLNHPHICTLYDIGSENGIDFMVMEHIEGETLADRLKKGALPLDQALRHAVEIADALDKAHRQGVVHRDLKPATSC